MSISIVLGGIIKNYIVSSKIYLKGFQYKFSLSITITNLMSCRRTLTKNKCK